MYYVRTGTRDPIEHRLSTPGRSLAAGLPNNNYKSIADTEQIKVRKSDQTTRRFAAFRKT